MPEQIRRVIKIGKMLLAKLVRDNFPENVWRVFGQLSEDLKSTENLGKMILDKICEKN